MLTATFNAFPFSLIEHPMQRAFTAAQRLSSLLFCRCSPLSSGLISSHRTYLLLLCFDVPPVAILFRARAFCLARSIHFNFITFHFHSVAWCLCLVLVPVLGVPSHWQCHCHVVSVGQLAPLTALACCLLSCGHALLATTRTTTTHSSTNRNSKNNKKKKTDANLRTTRQVKQ